MTKSIDFYFDFISPYSYLANKKIKVFKEKGINFNSLMSYVGVGADKIKIKIY